MSEATAKAQEKSNNMKEEDEMEDILKIKRKMVFVVGEPGAGKGTQCLKLAQKYGMKHVDYDALIREQNSLDENEPVTSDLSNQEALNLVKKEAADSDNEWLLVEGFPKSKSCVRRFDDVFEGNGEIRQVVYLETSAEVSLNRCMSRGTPADKPEVHGERLQDFESKSKPVLDNLESTGVLAKVAGDDPQQAVFDSLCRIFESSVMSPTIPRQISVVDVFKPKVVFVVGGPGSGKGTQCDMIREKFGFDHFSTGDLLRKELQAGSSQGKEIAQIMKDGKLVPSPLIVDLLKKAMVKSEKDWFLIDGFPRGQDNVDAWEECVGDKADVKSMLFLDASEEVCVERCTARGKSSGRADDNEETIRKRIVTYRNETKPILTTYEDQGIVKKANADLDVHEIFDDVSQHFEKLMEESLPGMMTRTDSFVDI